MENELSTSFLNTEGRALEYLNLYSGIGGNRKLLPENVKVTAVEYDKEIAGIYKDFYPNDTVIVGDANQFLLKNFNRFDFIWGSPPCPSHSRVRMMASKAGDYEPILPDMTLWQEIIFLQEFSKCPFVIENVIPYYEPLIRPTIKLDRHFFWANFKIQNWQFEKPDTKHNKVTGKTDRYGINLNGYTIEHRKDQIIRNCVNPDLGLHVFNCAAGVFKKDVHQTTLWNTH